MSRRNYNFRFPHGIDEPKLIMFWEVPVFIIGFACGTVGMIIRDPIALIVGLYAAWRVLRYFKRQLETAKRYEFMHAAYSTGMLPDTAQDPILQKFPVVHTSFTGK